MNYERIVRRLRQRIFDYPEVQETKASRVLQKAITRKVAAYPPAPVDRWGATTEDRRMLARHGVVWSD